eukprot:2487274-Rhodomonas_salina.1
MNDHPLERGTRGSKRVVREGWRASIFGGAASRGELQGSQDGCSSVGWDGRTVMSEEREGWL